MVEQTEEETLKCPKCGSIYVMSYRWEPYYKMCMKCHHDWRE